MNEGTIKDHIGVGLTIGLRLGGDVTRQATIIDVAAGPQWINLESMTGDDKVSGHLLNVTLKFHDGASVGFPETMTWPTPGDTFVAWCKKQRDAS